MMECRDRYGIQIFDIEDDNFTFDQRRAKRLMNLIIEKFGVGGIELSAMNGVSFSSLDKELLRLMRKAGFSTINLSYVSTDPHTQEEMRRPKGITDFDKIVEEANRVGLRVIAYGIFGMPGQTIEEMVDTLVYLTGTRVLIGPSVYYPTPGTPLFERCKREDVLPCDPSQWRSSALPIETKDFNRLDIGTLFRLARMINFIKGKIEEGVLNERVTWKELFQILINKKKIEVEVKAEEEFYAPCSRGDAITWADLLLLFFQERSFFSLRKDFRGILSLTKEMSSKKVIDYFFEKAMGRQVLGNTPDG
jgi:hypothetical protein